MQLGDRAVFPKGEAKEDWAILRALSERLGAKLPYDSLDQLRAKLFADHPTFGRIDYVPGPRRARSTSTRWARRARSPTRRSASADRRLLPDQPHRPRQRDDGRMRRPGSGAAKIAAE